MRYLFVLILSLIIFSACTDSTDPNPVINYEIFYSSTGENGNTNPGFFQIDFNTGNETTVATTPTLFSTSMSENGIVIYERDDSYQQRLIGLCDGGNLINVPFPNHPDPLKFIFEYDLPPHPSLSYNGHNLAYFVNAVDTTDDLSKKMPHLIIYNCRINDTSIVDISEFVATSKFNQFYSYQTAGTHIIVNEDASIVFFAIEFLDESGESAEVYQTIKYDNGVFSWVHSYLMMEPVLLSYNEFTKSLKVKAGEDVHVYDEMNNVYIREGYGDFTHTPHQYAQYAYLMSYADESGIHLRGINQSTRTWSLVAKADLTDEYGDYEFDNDMITAISADGELIAFAIRSESTQLYDLFSVDRKGNNLKLLKQGIYPEYICISPPIID